MSLKQSAASGVKWTTFSTAVTACLQVLQLTVLARLLKPEDFGLMAMVMIIIGFAQAYADMGISAALIHKQDVSRDQLSSLYWINILTGVVVSSAVAASTPLVVRFFNEPRLFSLLPVVSFSFVIGSMGMQFQCLLEKELKFNLLAKLEIVSAASGVVVAISGAALGHGVWALVWGQLTSAGVKALALTIAGWTKWPPRLHFRKSDLQGYIGFGLYQMGERSINYFNSRVDQLLIGSLLGAQELGYYNFAFNLVLYPVSRINPTLTRVAFPVFARMQDDTPRLRKAYIKLMNLVSSLNSPLLFGLAAVAPLFVPLAFGAKWMPAVPLVQILSVYAFIRCTGNPIGSLLLAKGRADLGFRWNLALLFVVSPTVYAGAKAGGAIGIAIALLCLQISLFYANYHFQVKPLVGACLGPYLWSVAKPLVIAALMATSVWGISRFSLMTFPWLAAEILSGIAVYFLLVWFFDQEFIAELKALLAKPAEGTAQ